MNIFVFIMMIYSSLGQDGKVLGGISAELIGVSIIAHETARRCVARCCAKRYATGMRAVREGDTTNQNRWC